MNPNNDLWERLQAKSSCRGQYSIQMEINLLAKKHGSSVSDDNPDGAHWNKLIRDKDWREMMRQKLLEEGGKWCDYKAGTCACESGYLSSKPRHHWMT